MKYWGKPDHNPPVSEKLLSFVKKMLQLIAECSYFTLFCVTFGKQRQRNEHRIITHAYTTIVLVAVAVKFCLI